MIIHIVGLLIVICDLLNYIWRNRMKEIDPLILVAQKFGREVDRVLRGPIPMEQTSLACWNAALIDARRHYNDAVAKCNEKNLLI
jgi:hypothetical protein